MDTPVRLITDHVVNPCNDRLRIETLDPPGAGGAHHHYRISGYARQEEVVANSETGETEMADVAATDIHFQNGPIAEAGVNGLTQEALLAIVVDRLRSFQSGPYACRENAIAITKIEEAMHWLQYRTIARMRRGVEGTHKI